MFEGCENLTTKVSAYEKAVSWITNSCVGQAVIVKIIVVYVHKFEQCRKSSANDKDNLIKNKINIFFTWFAINGLICNRF